jgi:hypothetical protein
MKANAKGRFEHYQPILSFDIRLKLEKIYFNLNCATQTLKGPLSMMRNTYDVAFGLIVIDYRYVIIIFTFLTLFAPEPLHANAKVCNGTVKNAIKGRLDGFFLKKINDMNLADGDCLKLNSPGGLPEFALIVGRIIYNKNIDLVISGWCGSACAEYILPAAQSITFSGEPLIGFHGNPIMADYFEQEQNLYNAHNCSYAHAAKLKSFYKIIGAKENFWKIQLKHLRLEDKKFERWRDCNQFLYKFVNVAWFPTSEQLQNDFGLEFIGTVCADDSKCYERKLSFRWKKGTKIAVGETVFVSKGWWWAFYHSLTS